MNTEQLKMIVEMINGLGTSGKEAFIWWLAMNYGLSFLQWSIFFVIVALVIRKVAWYFWDAHKRESDPGFSKLEAAYEAIRTAWLYASGTSDKELFPVYDQMREIMSKRGHKVN